MGNINSSQQFTDTNGSLPGPMDKPLVAPSGEICTCRCGRSPPAPGQTLGPKLHGAQLGSIAVRWPKPTFSLMPKVHVSYSVHELCPDPWLSNQKDTKCQKNDNLVLKLFT